MLPIPPEFMHSLNLALGYCVLAASSVNKGFYEGLGKKLGEGGAKKIEEIGKAVQAKLPWSKAEQEKMLKESPEKVESAVKELLQREEFQAEIKSFLEELAAAGSTTNNNLNFGTNNPQINQPQAPITINTTNNYNNPPAD